MKRKVKTLEEIKEIIKNIKPELEQKYKIKEIGIFGSWVRGQQTKRSDIDILVDFYEDAKISFFDFIEIEIYLSKKLGRKVDLVEKSSLKPYIGRHILKEVIYL